MDYGSDDPQGIDHQAYLQELIRNNPNIARFIATMQGQSDGVGTTTSQDPAQARYTANMREAYPLEYYASRLGGNVVANPAGVGRTLSPLVQALIGK